MLCQLNPTLSDMLYRFPKKNEADPPLSPLVKGGYRATDRNAIAESALDKTTPSKRRALARRGYGVAYGYIAVFLLMMTVVAGCSQYIDPNVPEPIRPMVEPHRNQEYLLYQPSSYDRRLSWPLVIVCPGSYPDSPDKQIRAWTQLAESRGFLVAVPALASTESSWSRNAEKQVGKLRRDEAHILATVQHIRGAYSVSEERIFIYGWAKGALAALRTGLRHPRLFRSVAMMQPKFDTDYLVDVGPAIDHYQPVYVHYRLTDTLTGKHARHCVDWLRSIGADVREDSAGDPQKTDCDRIIEFFEELIRTEPWIYIRTLPTSNHNPLEVQFKLRCSFDAVKYDWQFGDGDRSPVAEPIHVFAKPGTYEVTVTVDHADHTQYRRTVNTRVP